MKPLVKYRGGKSKEIPHLIKHIPQYNGRYIEPFFGGGADDAIVIYNKVDKIKKGKVIPRTDGEFLNDVFKYEEVLKITVELSEQFIESLDVP